MGYRIIIAEDKLAIRMRLVNGVNWNEMGFQVVADVMDGQDVLDYLQEHEVDVVFSDVQMCQVSGLQVASWVHEHRPEIKVVLISGYKEFDYVKEAMGYKVFDYILKPIDLTLLEDTFSKVKSELDQRKNQAERNLFPYLDYLEKQECREVLELAGTLVDNIFAGDEIRAEETLRSWKLMLDKVEGPYIRPLVLHVMENLFRRMEQDKVFLPESRERVTVFQQIRCLREDSLKEYIETLLLDILRGLVKKKSTELQDVIEKVKKYIDMHIAENFGVEELAAHVYLSRSHLSREFKAWEGVSVIDYIIQRRMEVAMELVKRGKLSTDEIAAAVGYADSRYFQRSFKKYTGNSIREYRNLQR